MVTPLYMIDVRDRPADGCVCGSLKRARASFNEAREPVYKCRSCDAVWPRTRGSRA